MNHAKIFCKSCLTCCVISLLVRFSLIAIKKVENFVFLCVRLYVEIFELVNGIEVLSILI